MENTIRDFLVIFLSILYEALPFVVLGALIAGFLEEMVPQQWIARFIPRNRVLAIGCSGLLGIVFPMCECGIIPVMRRLLRKGLPLSCCVAYILAGPIINVVVIGSTYVAFQPHAGGMWIVSLRMILGYAVAIGTALVVERLYRRYGDSLLTPLARVDVSQLVPKEDKVVDAARLAKRPLAQRLGAISETALHDFVDIMVFLILGALLAAAARQTFTHQQVEDLSYNYPVAAILIMMGLAIILSLCSEADAFVAASFTTLGAAPKLAFLVLGPMMDVKLYLLYTRVFQRGLIWTIISCVVIQTFIYMLLVHYFWIRYGPTPYVSP